MAFERFIKIGRGHTPKISIWKRGQISFNLGAIQELHINSYKYIILFFDKEKERIGFKFTNDDKELGCMKLTIHRTCTTVSGISFLRYYNINHSVRRKYNILYSATEENMYIVNLKEE